MRRKIKKNKRKISLSFKLMYLLIITLIVASVSMARYKTTFQGDVQGNTAKWVFKVNGETQNFIIDLADTIDTNSTLINKYAYTQSVIAPSSKGEFTITLDCTDCDVAVDYDICITPHTGTVLPKEFYIYSTTIDPKKTTVLNKNITKTISLQEIEQDSTFDIDIQWMWQVNFNKDESSFESQQLLLDITVIGKQHI